MNQIKWIINSKFNKNSTLNKIWNENPYKCGECIIYALKQFFMIKSLHKYIYIYIYIRSQ